MLLPCKKNRLSGKCCGGIIEMDDFNNTVKGIAIETPTGLEHKCPSNKEEEVITNNLISVLLPKKFGGIIDNNLFVLKNNHGY